MKKIDAKAEKNERNKIYALKFKKDRKKGGKREPAQYLNWCRTKGHPANCNCAYPSREEVIAASRK